MGMTRYSRGLRRTLPHRNLNLLCLLPLVREFLVLENVRAVRLGFPGDGGGRGRAVRRCGGGRTWLSSGQRGATYHVHWIEVSSQSSNSGFGGFPGGAISSSET